MNIFFQFPFSSTEPPSINRIIPVITPNNFLLTSRGRVVYGLLTVDKYNDSINEYISDEYRQFVHGRKMNYNESDIEKVIFHKKMLNLIKSSFSSSLRKALLTFIYHKLEYFSQPPSNAIDIRI